MKNKISAVTEFHTAFKINMNTYIDSDKVNNIKTTHTEFDYICEECNSDKMMGNSKSLGKSLDKSLENSTIKEKPKKNISNYAITGLYFFDNNAIKYSKRLKPSKRGEIEIIDLLNQYRKENNLSAEILGRGGAWLDTGSMDDYYKTSMFVSAVENRQGVKIACLEEIALQNKWINKEKVQRAIKFYGN